MGRGGRGSNRNRSGSGSGSSSDSGKKGGRQPNEPLFSILCPPSPSFSSHLPPREDTIAPLRLPAASPVFQAETVVLPCRHGTHAHLVSRDASRHCAPLVLHLVHADDRGGCNVVKLQASFGLRNEFTRFAVTELSMLVTNNNNKRKYTPQ